MRVLSQNRAFDSMYHAVHFTIIEWGVPDSTFRYLNVHSQRHLYASVHAHTKKTNTYLGYLDRPPKIARRLTVTPLPDVNPAQTDPKLGIRYTYIYTYTKTMLHADSHFYRLMCDTAMRHRTSNWSPGSGPDMRLIGLDRNHVQPR